MRRNQLVVIESPFRNSDYEKQLANTELARNVCRIAALRGLRPRASHIFYTQFLDDTDAGERQLGIDMGLADAREADKVWMVLRDGEMPSTGMKYAEADHQRNGRRIRYFRTADNGKTLTFVPSFDETPE